MSDGDEESGETEGKFHPIKIYVYLLPLLLRNLPLISITSKSKEKLFYPLFFIFFHFHHLFQLVHNKTFFRCFNS